MMNKNKKNNAKKKRKPLIFKHGKGGTVSGSIRKFSL